MIPKPAVLIMSKIMTREANYSRFCYLGKTRHHALLIWGRRITALGLSDMNESNSDSDDTMSQTWTLQRTKKSSLEKRDGSIRQL